MLVCDPMGKITVFTVDDCPFCRKAKDLLALKNVKFDSISLTEKPEWRSLLFLLTNGRTKVPQIFFNEKLIGGSDALQKLEDEGELDQLIRKALEERDPAFPPPLRKPSGEEFLQIIPCELQQKWQHEVEALNAQLGGSAERPISSLLLMLETPEDMVVVCTAGPGKEIYTVGGSGAKGSNGSEEKLYCQVAIERKETLFIDDPTQLPGLEKNEDYVKYGYGYYLGAPWAVGDTRGTIVAMETKPGVLKPDHRAIIEAMRDGIERDFAKHREDNG